MKLQRPISSFLVAVLFGGLAASSALAQYGRQPYPQDPYYPPTPSERALANSGTNTVGIDRREFAISMRIEEGVRSGRIPEHEARRLRSWERDIERREALYKSDGVATRQERIQLRDELIELRSEVEHQMQGRHHRHSDWYNRY